MLPIFAQTITFVWAQQPISAAGILEAYPSLVADGTKLNHRLRWASEESSLGLYYPTTPQYSDMLLEQ